jgi:hypothetical protein
MANIANKFGLGGGGGVNFTDPREFLRAISTSSTTTMINASSASAGTAATAGFWTQLALQGVADNTNWTANTYKTILSISSGMGYVSHLFGPAGLAGTPTTTFEITVDGVLTEIPVVALSTAQRAILGPLLQGTAYTTANHINTGSTAINAGKDTYSVTSTGVQVLGPMALRFMGVPCLKFSQSLLIRMKSSEDNSTTANQERQSGVQYVVMG